MTAEWIFMISILGMFVSAAVFCVVGVAWLVAQMWKEFR